MPPYHEKSTMFSMKMTDIDRVDNLTYHVVHRFTQIDTDLNREKGKKEFNTEDAEDAEGNRK